ncbi:hypothetical protein B0I33_10337 [Prauserella shujinwangii]|uniref:Excreted virulence factor EspC (Type VII ESX diderm) n=1 Tax=Prauserella shujinwangii TaxID=1453103 RepID=A0A2T0LY04_9PSEU|nr:hypothetical protein [Prauserella shujinwangii]PRX49005.1 hypothetical protein B0I33_10337 [Prauserella shujinwangii]
MSGRFEVELDVLDGAATAVSQTMHDMETCKIESICGPAEMYGHDGVHEAFEHFCGRWQQGVELLIEDGATIAGALNRAVEGYGDFEGEAEQVFGGQAEP